MSQMKVSIDKCFNELSKEWGSLDFVVHALAFSDKSELSGRFINTSRQKFFKFSGYILFQFN